MIGIFGGTFDPVHYGHLRSAIEILQGLSLQHLRMIPCLKPPHRDQPVASAAQRLRMLETAAQDIDDLIVDKREIERNGVSYMVDTLASLREDFKSESLCLIVGLDAFAGFTSWHRWEDIFDLSHLIVMQRPGDIPELSAELDQHLLRRKTEDISKLQDNMAGFIHTYTVTQLDISASSIRAQISAGMDPRYLLPDSVLEIIYKEKIYNI